MNAGGWLQSLGNDSGRFPRPQVMSRANRGHLKDLGVPLGCCKRLRKAMIMRGTASAVSCA
jgi:hypothetical protein